MIGDLARMDDYDPNATFGDTFAQRFGAAPPDAFGAAAARLTRPYQAVQQRAGTSNLTEIPGAIASAVAPDILGAGATMTKNPYPEGSEEASWYEDQRARNMGTWARGMALNTMGTGAVVGAPAKAGEKLLGAGPVRRTMGDTAAIDKYPAPTGSMNPLDNIAVTFRGKQPKDMTPEELQAFGEHYGVKNLGPLSPLQTFQDLKGGSFQVPGGLEGNWTYADLLHMKANPINPANVDRELHAQMQRKLGRTMTPEELTNEHVWNGLMFGMTSPNNPLFPNQVTTARLRLRTPEMLDDLASMIPQKWATQPPTKAERDAVSDAIAARYGLNKAAAGGLGSRGTANYTRVAELAQMFKQNPDFFRKLPEETWGQAVERISSQVQGLSMKTGSFGTVWQDPANAAISAIDRHMARKLDEQGGLFANAADRKAWQDRSVNLWNDREAERVIKQTAKNEKAAAEGKKVRPVAPANTIDNWDTLVKQRGSDGFIGEMLLSHVGDAQTPRFRYAKGNINPDIPAHLAQADWVKEPSNVFKMGQTYKRALEENQKLANESGLNLFMSQWMEWDRIRNRFEPHENMFPGLSKMPAMSVEQLREVDKAHRQTGHKTYGKDPEAKLKPTRPLTTGLPSSMGYLGMGGVAAMPLLYPQGEESVR